MTTSEATTAERISYFLTLDELEKICREQPMSYLVDTLLPADDVHVAVGDSGIGKTPWAYQLGICVAAGVPFCGYSVKQGPVLYFDYENERDQKLALGRALRNHLGLSGYPSNFHVLNDTDDPVSARLRLELAIKQFQPALVIIDTLYSLDPSVTKNEIMGSVLNRLRAMARKNRCTILLLHHVRKENSQRPTPSLPATNALTWLQEASGSRVLINLTHTRFALAEPSTSGRGNDAALIMKAHVKLRGQLGPFYLERMCDEEGEAAGYSVMTGVDLLGDPGQQEAFKALPQTFRFKDAVRIYGRTDNPTNEFLGKCCALGLVEKTAKGYRKTMQPELTTATQTKADNLWGIPETPEISRN
jgi:hypothetical protein